MNWKEFLKPDIRKIILFLLPIIFLSAVYVILWAAKSDQLINKTPVDFIIFHFPCFIESRLLCNGANCCFSSIFTQIGSSLMFYLPWFLFSWFIVWVNDKVELRGYLWRRMQKIEEPSKKSEIKEETKIEKTSSEANDLIKREQMIKAEEERIKQEKEEIFKTIDDVNIRKLIEIGLDVNLSKIRCSNCINWDTVSNKNLSKLIKKHGIDILWKYKCKNCKKGKTKKWH